MKNILYYCKFFSCWSNGSIQEYKNCLLDGISDKDAGWTQKQITLPGLPEAFVEQRYEIANEPDSDLKQAAHELSKNNKGIQ